ncbi:hypothetical protein ACHAXA_001180 [Cyclostephanos tholiformis]|uniref:SSD domain-containing protein n=1 Tax=Cyclostephanos tholiformis TaxID=382380 RepID=A0ABD3RC38_9STRA
MKLKTIETQAIDNNLDTSDESFRSFLELAGLGDCVDYYCDGGSYHDDDDDDGESKGGIPSTTAAAARRVRNAKASHLVSILLFVVGSVLYLVLAVWDYRWARSVQGWPEDVLLDYEDDITYNNYRLKLLYYGSVAGVAEAEGGGRSRRTLLGRMRGDWESISPWVNFFHPDFDFPSKPTAAVKVDHSNVEIKYVPSMYKDDNLAFDVDSPPNERKLVELTREVLAYYDEFWIDLPVEIQGAFGVLGYNETTWNNSIEPESSGLFWDDLTPEQRDAALFIRYTAEMWDAEVLALVSPTAGPVPFDATEAVEPGYYDSYSWDEMPPEVQDAFEILGYDEELWDDPLGISLKASTEDNFWADLTPEQQDAASIVGYNQQSWDVPPTESDAYDVLDDDSLIYFTKHNWWVGEYTVVYFSASFCFVLSGFLDFFMEKHILDLLTVLAGVTGCIAAVYLSNNELLSSVFEVISVHFFLFVAIKDLFGEESLAGDAASWMKRIWVLADIEFLLGAIIDVCL